MKGALTQEQADAKFNEWLAKKEAAVAARFEQTAKENEDWLNQLAGIGYVPKKKDKTVTLDEALDETPAAEEPQAEAPAEEAAPEASEETEGDAKE